jgi:hypothetical protein
VPFPPIADSESASGRLAVSRGRPSAANPAITNATAKTVSGTTRSKCPLLSAAPNEGAIAPAIRAQALAAPMPVARRLVG